MKLKLLERLPLAFLILLFCFATGGKAIHQKNKRELQIDLKEALDQLINQTLKNRSNIPLKPLYTREEHDVFSTLNNLLGKLVHDVSQKKANETLLYNDLMEFEDFSRKLHFINEKLRTLLEIVDLRTQNKALLKHSAREILEKFEILREAPSAEDLILKMFFSVPRNLSEHALSQQHEEVPVKKHIKSNITHLPAVKEISNVNTTVEPVKPQSDSKRDYQKDSNSEKTHDSLPDDIGNKSSTVDPKKDLGQLNEFFKRFKELTKTENPMLKSEESGLESEGLPIPEREKPQSDVKKLGFRSVPENPHTADSREEKKRKSTDQGGEQRQHGADALEEQKQHGVDPREQQENEDLEKFLKSINEKKNYNFDFGKLNINIDEEEQSSDPAVEQDNPQLKSNEAEEMTDLSTMKSPRFLEKRLGVKDTSALSRKFDSKLPRAREGEEEETRRPEDFNLDKLSRLYGV